jgi:hypothetical protein
MVGGESRGGGEVEKRREERGVCVMCNSWVKGRRRRRRRSELQSCRGVQVGAEKKLTEVGWARARAPVTPDSKLLARVHCWRDSKGCGRILARSFEEERLFPVFWILLCNPGFISFKIGDNRLAQYV